MKEAVTFNIKPDRSNIIVKSLPAAAQPCPCYIAEYTFSNKKEQHKKHSCYKGKKRLSIHSNRIVQEKEELIEIATYFTTTVPGIRVTTSSSVAKVIIGFVENRSLVRRIKSSSDFHISQDSDIRT
jgi:hypothetical protein